MNFNQTQPKGLLIEITVKLGDQYTNQEIISAETSTDHQQLRKQFKLLQEMADSNATVITNTPMFNLNLGRLLVASASKVHRHTDGIGFKKPMPIDLVSEYQKNHVFEIDIYNDLIAVTENMLDGKYLFHDAYITSQDHPDDPPFVASDILLDLAQNLQYLVPSADLVTLPQIKFKLIPYDLKTGKKGALGHEIDE